MFTTNYVGDRPHFRGSIALHTTVPIATHAPRLVREMGLGQLVRAYLALD